FSRIYSFAVIVLPLMKAHELLNSPEAWCRGSPAEDAQGNKVVAVHPKAVRWCALGAIQKSYPPDQWGEAMDNVLRAVNRFPVCRAIREGARQLNSLRVR